MTYYLKYRSQRIEEIDLTEIREALERLAKSEEIPHAFLFAGPRGAGKTSTARILAKVINCENRTQDKEHRTKEDNALIEPCNECEQCISITKGNSLNVIEIDAASNRGVDDIRSLRETIKLSPTGGKFKVYIIDEAHMLTPEAANALLKTLEEPPNHAVFVLATTAPEKLPDTIRSRCTTLVFRKGTAEEVIRCLERAVTGEKIKVEKEVLSEIAKNVDGSFREAHKILEQSLLGGKKVSLEMIRELLGQSFTDPIKFLQHLEKRDAKTALEDIEEAVQKGINLKVYTVEIIRKLRELLLAQVRGNTDPETDLNTDDLKTLIELFSEAAKQLPTSVVPQLPLELAVVKWCALDETQSTKSDTQNVIHISKLAAKAVTHKVEVKKEGIEAEKTIAKQTDEKAPASKNSTPQASPPKDLEEGWKEIMRRTKTKNYSVEALLRSTRPRSFDGKDLEIEVFYQFHKEKIEKENYRSIVEEAACEVLGGKVRLLCILSDSKQRAIDLVNVTEDVDEDIVKVAEEIFGKEDYTN